MLTCSFMQPTVAGVSLALLQSCQAHLPTTYLAASYDWPPGRIVTSLMRKRCTMNTILLKSQTDICSNKLPKPSVIQRCYDSLTEEEVRVQAIKVETSPGIVETCQLTQLEQVASEESARLAAMHHVGPIHTFMFSGSGRLLMANKRGRERYQHISEPLHPWSSITF